MKTTEQYIELLKQYKQDNAVSRGISRIGIFGSVARHEQTEDSDVDVCVQLERPDIFSLVHIKADLEQLFEKSVDVVHIRPHMDNLLKTCIEEDGIYAD